MPPPRTSTPAAATDDGADRVRGRLMQQSLKALLDRVRGARDVLPHLAALEVALGRRGASAIGVIAPNGLAKICSQLSNLPLPRDDPPLHDLLHRLLDALDAHRPQQRYLSTFASDSKMMVGEASHTDFAAAAQEMATTQRDGL